MRSTSLQPLSCHGRLYLATAPAHFPFRQYISSEDLSLLEPAPDKASLAFILTSVDASEDETPPQTSVSRPAATRSRPRHTRLRICTVEGCTKRAKMARKCWHHGGSTECKIPDCGNRAKTKGLCWSHGGGKLCAVGQCQTVAVSNGVCWAHGGGKRCRKPRCSRPAYGNAENLCKVHSGLGRTGKQQNHTIVL